ncbi:receptor-like protein kinase [Gossypium australe]|uniref:Receptor-like protein kinase n=1 Tax=Gossypium australe TaxID=47621 RepID=A0A5B6WIR5_9ROSI|nr:receptor-like protein kinase [Gossypium australe]
MKSPKELDQLHIGWHYWHTRLAYREKPVKILTHEVQELRNKRILLVKVLWHSHSFEEATWESKEGMRSQYPHIILDKFQG